MKIEKEINEKKEELKILILNEIQNASKKEPVKLKTITNNVNLYSRYVKSLISELRENYAIVSKDTVDGGYWIAESDSDILDFINLIENRKKAYAETILKMEKHFKEM